MKNYRILLLLVLLISPKAYTQTAKIQFHNFSLEIDGMKLWEQGMILDKKFSIDGEVDIELGETLEGTSIRVVNSKLTEMQIEMCFETSITIMNEGPHCDLIDWKHHTSNWKKLKKSETNTFSAQSYSKQDLEKFPNVSIEEIIQAVEEQCSGWAELAKTIKAPNDYPSGVGVSRYFLRISGIDSSGKSLKRILTFNMPMGC